MKNRLLFLFILFCGVAQGQNMSGFTSYPQSDNQSKESSTPPKQLPTSVRSWQIDEYLGVADTCQVDTAIVSFQDNTPVYNHSIANSWNGNLGSPLQSKIFFKRYSKTDFLFAKPYNIYNIDASDVKFFNTKTPYVNLTYRTSMPIFKEEDYFRALYSMNFNKHLNIGGLVNFILGRGRYRHQAARAVNGGFFSSYSGKRYEFNAVFMFNDFRNQENGGIKNTNELTNNSEYKYTITNLTESQEAISTFKNAIFYFNHKYSLGFNKKRILKNDSLIYDFIPVTSFIHTIKYENNRKRYTELSINDFYENTFYSNKNTLDSVRHQILRNVLALTMEEKFNTLLRFGLAVFVEHDLVRNSNYCLKEKYIDKYYQNFIAGATISKNEGDIIKYNVSGRVVFAGHNIGDFDVKANINSHFRFFKDTIGISASANLGRQTADFFSQNYYSNHFRWENSFSPLLTAHVQGLLSSKLTGISLGFNFATLRNYIYFNKNALPSQFIGGLQVMDIYLDANIKVWKFHLDNKVVYQLSSNKEVLPLPDLSLYSNLYFKSTFFKILLTQIGISCRYNTSYYGNAYMPATGQFYLQDHTKIGNYPDLNVYVNFHLKRIRIYVQYAHLNMYRFGGKGYLLMPNYPLNPATFQIGLSWAFYN